MVGKTTMDIILFNLLSAMKSVTHP